MTFGLFKLLLDGLWITIQLLVFSAALAVLIAFTAGLARLSRRRAVRFFAAVYVEFFRGTSALVLMFWLFFALPLLGWQLAPLWAGTLALSLSFGAYGSEVVRGAVLAVSPGQREAATALSFTPWQRLRLVVLPQAVPEMLPTFSNQLVELLKATSLASAVTIGDLTFQAQSVRLATGESAQVYGLILGMYFVIAFTLTRGMRLLERRAKANLGLGRLVTGPEAPLGSEPPTAPAGPPPLPEPTGHGQGGGI
ncbi:ectoine/hydroxyectoine ABC transporter permease subunit EhuC [Wenjunlia vitaminophila]|uniref:Ectoine/hydroxyectoine ABC transporter permease subunit EhuC n=1 Tax=Wenjunlia vitaminophila TaxID=76728 RepID=A0A0T6LPC1_WENVI|nr:ectoine/hydroxyectoine ABC transporter permease subunit EhuC [Wenjunlia vitaminophila]KRV47785.1 ectoine/hydroxyectoine ABC transporter permease subunit EhuC [Wenjunlia vitaminophila]